MGKKLTIEFVREEFEKEGYILLTMEYVNAHGLLKYICPKGDYGIIKWNDWQQGHRCAECAGVKKLTIAFIKDEFEKEGYTLLSKKYIGCAQKLKYICSKNHRWSITWNDWRDGCRCYVCGVIERASRQRLSIDFIRKQFEKEGYTLLTKEYINSKQKLDYICPKKHRYCITWDSWWNSGQRCRQCYLENNKGEKHPKWNSNLTNEDRVNGRHINGYEDWASAVKERDNFTCQMCGDNKGGNLVSHHLDSYNSSPELRTILDNGVCLCESCHKNFHHQYGYGNNTRKQFEDFIGAEA